MKTKIFFVLSLFLLLVSTTYVFTQFNEKETQTNESGPKEPEVVILVPPITVTNRMTLDDIKPEDRLPFVKLELAYYKCEDWNDVVGLHTVESVRLIESMGMKERFEKGKEDRKAKKLGTTYISYLTAELNGEQIMIAQFIPFQLKDEDYSDCDFYFVDSYRKINNQWKTDRTLNNTELGIIITNTPPSRLKEEVHKWFWEKWGED